jgi:hypothetical protein
MGLYRSAQYDQQKNEDIEGVNIAVDRLLRNVGMKGGEGIQCFSLSRDSPGHGSLVLAQPMMTEIISTMTPGYNIFSSTRLAMPAILQKHIWQAVSHRKPAI